ncbi:MAG: BatD family protein [Ginsengibacter sp.]
MMKFLKPGAVKFLFYFLFLNGICVSNSLSAQIKFSAVCPDKTIGKNDYLQIQFMVENAPDVEAIIPPSFQNFNVVSGPNQQSGMSIVNGKTDQYIALGFYLKPKRTGKYIIGPAIAKVNGKAYYTSPVTVEVTNASLNSSVSSSGNSSLSPFGNMNLDFPTEPSIHRFDDYILRKGESVSDKVQKNLFIKLDVSKQSCYTGQPIIASYKLYTRLRSESVVTNAPSFNGFSVSELDANNNSVKVEKYNGRDYNVYTLRKVQLYPLQPGTFTLDPVVADNKVTFIKSEYAGTQKGDMFFDMLQDFANSTSPQNSVIEEHVTLQSKPVQILVKPLPQENMPEDFKGAVGDFKISASLEKKNVTTDDAGNIKLNLAGAGNIHLINSPKINWPEGIDSYEAKVTDDIDKFSIPMNGSKTFTYPFTVSKAGNYTIPAISFSFFDPTLEKYKTLHTQPLTVKVSRGRGNPQKIYVKNAKLTEDSDGGLWTNYSSYIIGGLTLLTAFVFIAARKRSIATKKSESLSAALLVSDNIKSEQGAMNEFIIPENPLTKAHEKLVEGNEIEFYQTLDISIKKYLAEKFKVPREELTKKRLTEEIDKCNVGLNTSLMLSSLLDEIELNVYAPTANSNHLQVVYEKASEVIALLNKQVCENNT